MTGDWLTQRASASPEPIKVVFWDLDGTLWNGTLDESADDDSTVSPATLGLLNSLDVRGILNGIVTQATQASAEAALRRSGLLGLFMEPRYRVGSKAASIADVLRTLNLLPRSAAYVDDTDFHLAEVASLLPEVLVVPAGSKDALLAHPRFQGTNGPSGDTRRHMHEIEAARVAAATVFTGDRPAFLASCSMSMRCRVLTSPSSRDVDEARSLFARAHRMSAVPHSGPSPAVAPQLGARVATAHLRDRFGDCGLVAAAALAPQLESPCVWPSGPVVVQLAVSCRVMGRGVLEAFVWWLAHGPHAVPPAILVATTDPVNEGLRMALRLCGFAKAESGEGWQLLSLARPDSLRRPEWIGVNAGVGVDNEQTP